jgi:glycogen synthase kinase 3 beta
MITIKKKLFQKAKPDPEFIDLISKLLKYPPRERLKPLEALLHPYFNELR